MVDVPMFLKVDPVRLFIPNPMLFAPPFWPIRMMPALVKVLEGRLNPNSAKVYVTGKPMS